MQHLTLEALARLVDESPEAGEGEHLAACDECRAELEAMRGDTAALGRLGAIEPTGAEWAALAARLEREGLIAPTGDSRGMFARRWTPRLLRLAAALALYAVGAASGLALRSRPPATVAVAPGTTSAVRTTAAPVAGAPAEPPVAEATPEPAATQADLTSTEQPATPAEAMRAVRAAEQQYLRAYSRYAELTSAQPQDDDPVARVAALQSIVLTTQAALDRAPADPVINGYHLTAVAQRDAALRQIALRSNGPWF